jgi:hypothetical protein
MDHTGVEDLGVEQASAEHRGVEDLGVGKASGGFGSAGLHGHAGVEKKECARAPHGARVGRGGSGGRWRRGGRQTVVRGRQPLKWGNFWPRPPAGYIHRHHHCWVALEPTVMRSDEMGEFLAAAARGLYT